MDDVKEMKADGPEVAPGVEPKPTVRPNRLGRWALAGAILAWVLFVLSAFVPLSVSWVLGSVSGVVAGVAFAAGLVSLRRPPRGISTAALVFSGALVVIFLIVIVGVNMLKSLPAADL